MQRREFLHLSLSALLAGIVGVDKFKTLYTPYMLEKVGDHVVTGYHETIAEYRGVKQPLKSMGYGVVLGDYYLTVAHLAIRDEITIPTPRGPEKRKLNVVDSNHYLDTERYHKLEKVVIDLKADLAVFRLTKPFKRKWKFRFNRDEVKLNDKVYLIGNPGHTGQNIREVRVSDLDGAKYTEWYDNTFFGVNDVLIGGDSGTPVVNENFELIGLSSYQISKSLGYVKKIKPFIDVITNNERKIRNLV